MPACVQGCQLQHQNNPDLLLIDKVEDWSSSHANFSVPKGTAAFYSGSKSCRNAGDVGCDQFKDSRMMELQM
jgi:hypothetical protein